MAAEGQEGSAEVRTLHDDLTHIGGFSVTRVLNEDVRSKSIFLEGTFEGQEKPAVVILQKKPFPRDEIASYFRHRSDVLVEKTFVNDIYGQYVSYPDDICFTGVQTTIIHPATEKHIAKYEVHKSFFVEETPEIYRDIVLPHLQERGFSLQWVSNILDHTAEAERIVFEDSDPEKGFILLPDLKWDGTTLQTLYLLVIVRDTGIRSLRDLRGKHIPLLENILSKASETISEKYGLPRNCQIAYFHYRPTFEHLHVHIKAIGFDAPGTQVGRAHLLTDVITNLKASSDYYAGATLGYTLSEVDSLASALGLH
ncbi:m7GpppX diphosphatase [Neocloeon triangulifer]|uniref:m7GpppX diphosphatase n=1 Tax=Neocloeon triangulifer TaxID=2078957 RepID=UPI00286EF20C|nr:m7GpppX diphosphatase [Neocloeon triangulifer]